MWRHGWIVCLVVGCSSQSGDTFDARPVLDGAPVDTMATWDAPAPDASARIDAALVDASLSTIDNDGDNYCETPPCTNASSAEADCDDNDPDVHPNQLQYFVTPRADGSYDYDCSGHDDPEIDQTFGGCTVSFQPFTCQPMGAGWSTTVPACGVTASYADSCSSNYDVVCMSFCEQPPAMCTACWECAPHVTARTQACR